MTRIIELMKQGAEGEDETLQKRNRDFTTSNIQHIVPQVYDTLDKKLPSVKCLHFIILQWSLET